MASFFSSLFGRDKTRLVEIPFTTSDTIQTSVDPVAVPDTYYALFAQNSDAQSSVRAIGKRIGNSTISVQRNGEAVKLDEYRTERIVRFIEKQKTRMIRELTVGGDLVLVPVESANPRKKVARVEILDPRDVDFVINDDWTESVFSRGNSRQAIKNARRYRREPDIVQSERGLSVMSSMVEDYRADRNAREGLAKHPSIVLKTDISKIDPQKIKTNDQIETVYAKLRSLFRVGRNGDRVITTSILEEGPNAVVQLDAFSAQSATIERQEHLRDRVCSAFEVQRSVLGYTDGINYATAAANYKVFIEQTIEPWQQFLSESLTDFYLECGLLNAGESILLECDSTYSEMEWHDDQRADVKAGIVTVDEARADRGLDPIGQQ